MSKNTHNRVVILVLLGILVVSAVAFGLKANRQFIDNRMADAAISVSADSVNADNEGRLVSASGRLSVEQPPEDPQLGLQAADAVVLIREVEMFQWQEVCHAGSCTLKATWSPDLIDSTRFSEAAGHTNPDRFPLASDRFTGKGMRLGSFVPDVSLVVSKLGAIPHPITEAELRGNLAASFSVVDGILVSASPNDSPAVGDLRIRYLIVEGGDVTLTGIQQSSSLVDSTQARKP